MKPKYFLVVGVLILLGVAVFSFTGPRSKSDIDTTQAKVSPTQKQLSGVEILETLDANAGTPRFKLHVQAHEDFSNVPQKLILLDKATNTVANEYSLMQSAYPEECVSHTQMTMNMKKWETDWFSLPGVSQVDSAYTPKLAGKYAVQVVYADQLSKTYVSMHSIGNVCYQVSQAVPASPNPKEEAQEGKNE